MHKSNSRFSDSKENEEIVRVTNGFRPNFEKENPISEPERLRSLKTMKRGKVKGKRVLKRIHQEATSSNSSDSILISEYVDVSQDVHLEMNSDAQLIIDRYANPQDDEMAHIPEDENEDVNSSDSDTPNIKIPKSVKESASSSMPADEHYDSEANLVLGRNSPRESFKVFHQ
jgi:hypothetical protein